MQNTLVMVVEDDVNLREAIVDTLEMDNISVIEASDGEEALALLRQNNITLVVRCQYASFRWLPVATKNGDRVA